MKMKAVKTACLIFAVGMLAGCQQNGLQQQESTAEISAESRAKEISFETEESEEEEEKAQIIQFDLDNKEKPQLSHLELSGTCSGRLRNKASIYSYDANVFYNETVGLIGTPVMIETDDDVKNMIATITYRPDELRGVPEKNIRLFYSDEDSQIYSFIENALPDTDRHSVSFVPQGNGIYMLLDVYAYGSAMGMDVGEYSYESDKTLYESDWERMTDTGDIMKIADTEWAKENAPEFHVGTARQLAGVVYYSNVIGGSLNICLENDIDLNGYEWSPMGWYNTKGEHISASIYFDGQGHELNNMKINSSESHAGLTGYVNSLTVKNLTMHKAMVSGYRNAGILGGECNGTKEFINLHIDGVVKGGKDSSAALLGWGGGGCLCENCELNIKVNGIRESYPTSNERVRQNNSVDDLVKIFINEQGQVQRTELPKGKYKNLAWVIKENGIQKLSRSAENEMTIPDWIWEKNFKKNTTYTINMEVYSIESGGYIDCSNTITFVYK